MCVFLFKTWLEDEFLFITRDYDVVYHIYAYLRVHLQNNMLCKHTQILVCL